MTEILSNGHTDPAFKRVEQAFLDNFRAGKETGAAFSLYVQGKKVIDIWAGFMNHRRTRPWHEHTLANVFSVTKGITATLALKLVDQGKLDLDKKVSDYWPEFAKAGKENITVRMLLNHQAAVVAVRKKLPQRAIYDWDLMTSELAAQKPWWTPGKAHGYHAVSFGWLVGHLIRIVTGKSVGHYLKEEITGPLKMDFHIGLSEEDHHRSATIFRTKHPSIHKDITKLIWAGITSPKGATRKAFTNPWRIVTGVNGRSWKKAEIPAANGQTDARSLARFYGILANGGKENGIQILSKDTIPLCSQEESHGMDRILRTVTRFSLGFMLNQDRPEGNMGKGRKTFGHPGAGGALGFADPDAGLGFGYVMNAMDTYILVDPRAKRLIDAVYDCL